MGWPSAHTNFCGQQPQQPLSPLWHGLAPATTPPAAALTTVADGRYDFRFIFGALGAFEDAGRHLTERASELARQNDFQAQELARYKSEINELLETIEKVLGAMELHAAPARFAASGDIVPHSPLQAAACCRAGTLSQPVFVSPSCASCCSTTPPNSPTRVAKVTPRMPGCKPVGLVPCALFPEQPGGVAGAAHLANSNQLGLAGSEPHHVALAATSGPMDLSSSFSYWASAGAVGGDDLVPVPLSPDTDLVAFEYQ
eukprot:SM000140S00599  [mRNA]  locus=s140:93876:94873:- [translate_table: standard]